MSTTLNLKFNIQCSRILIGMLVFVYGGAALCVMTLPFHLTFKILLLIFCISAFLYQYWRRVLFGGKRSIMSFAYDGDGEWLLYDQQRRAVKAQLQKSSVVLPYFTVLHFRIDPIYPSQFTFRLRCRRRSPFLCSRCPASHKKQPKSPWFWRSAERSNASLCSASPSGTQMYIPVARLAAPCLKANCSGLLVPKTKISLVLGMFDSTSAFAANLCSRYSLCSRFSDLFHSCFSQRFLSLLIFCDAMSAADFHKLRVYSLILL